MFVWTFSLRVLACFASCRILCLLFVHAFRPLAKQWSSVFLASLSIVLFVYLSTLFFSTCFGSVWSHVLVGCFVLIAESAPFILPLFMSTIFLFLNVFLRPSFVHAVDASLRPSCFGLGLVVWLFF